jgi:translation initiation factor IF-3
LEAALARAAESGYDLVEVSPMAKPPVCKIMDYGRFKYEAKKKQNEAKKKQVVVKLKEIKLRPRTDEHDYGVKLRQAREFLEEGHKVKVTIVFRGREIAHREIGQKQLQEMVADLKDVAMIELPPRMEGKAMFMQLAASAKGKAAPARPSGPPVSVQRPAAPGSTGSAPSFRPQGSSAPSTPGSGAPSSPPPSFNRPPVVPQKPTYQPGGPSAPASAAPGASAGAPKS